MNNSYQSNNNSGIYLWGSSNTVKNNSFFMNNNYGIYLMGDLNGIKNNTFFMNNNSGIYFDDSSLNSIMYNNFNNHTKSGMFIDPVSEDNRIFFNNYLYKEYLPGKAFDLISAGTIPLSNIAIGLKVGASLFLVIFLLSTFRRETSTDMKE